MSTVSQIVTVALAVFAIIWNQQRSTDKLRDRLDASDREHRAAIDKLRDGLGEVKERLVRIEGFLGRSRASWESALRHPRIPAPR